MYGADPQRTQAQTEISVRPPFRVVWSRGLGTLIEFPAVVPDGVAYIANAQRHRPRARHADRHVVWRHDTPHGKMAASPAVWGDQLVVHGMDGHVWVLRRSDGRLLWHYTVGSPVESSPVVIGAGSTSSAPGTGRSPRSTCARTGCAGGATAAARSPRPRRSRGSTLYIGDYCGRLLALRAANGALRWSRSVNGRVYGTPAVAAGRVFVPSSTGGSLTAFSTRGALSLAPLDRLVRLLVAGGRARPRLLRLVQRRLLRALGADGRDALGARRPAARSRARRWSSTASRTPARSRTASSASTRAAAASCSTSRTVSTCRSRARAGACSCTATRASTRSRRDEARC